MHPQFILTAITSDPQVVRAASAAGVERIGIDIERLGKAARQGHIPGAQSWELRPRDGGESHAHLLPQHDHPHGVVVYCDCPNEISAARLARQLQRAGFANVRPLVGGLKAAILLNNEPALDTAVGAQGLASAGMVVTLSPFKTNLDISDVLLPIAPFTETSGSFVNAEGRLQGFHAVVRPLGDTRPAWKVLRVLGNLLDLPGFDADSSQAVLASVLPGVANGDVVDAARLSNTTSAAIDTAPAEVEPCVASIYQLDGLVRRSTALQLTADARAAQAVEGATA